MKIEYGKGRMKRQSTSRAVQCTGSKPKPQNKIGHNIAPLQCRSALRADCVHQLAPHSLPRPTKNVFRSESRTTIITPLSASDSVHRLAQHDLPHPHRRRFPLGEQNDNHHSKHSQPHGGMHAIQSRRKKPTNLQRIFLHCDSISAPLAPIAFFWF